jgi:hypothetical protein
MSFSQLGNMKGNTVLGEDMGPIIAPPMAAPGSEAFSVHVILIEPGTLVIKSSV